MAGVVWRVVSALALSSILAIVGVAPALAHEGQTVGAFQFVVGWGDEPSYTGFKNSVQITISEPNGGQAVTDITDGLKVEVTKGAAKISLPLVANFRVGAFGTPGDYRAWVTPTRPGTYTFRLSGSIRGQSVDESFSSSKTTFNDVEDVATIQFPAKDPSTGQLATRVDREVPRLESEVRRIQDRADGARTLAVVGVGIGVLGLLTAGAAVVRGRGRRAAGQPVSETPHSNA